jgi:DNA-binding NtrC family response regulator
MALSVAIFEDDHDIADLLKERLETLGFEVETHYSLETGSWQEADVVLADFRNRIVPFRSLLVECQEREIPVIAISGAETSYQPQLLKPFTMEDLQSLILKTLMQSGQGNKAKPAKKKPWLSHWRPLS